ncbi:hypothetical protein MSEN_25440 [Mycolicibacter senuensis]|uniref:Uncharacterized protein n=1 Tax=Mycolicibacter senuensis TaxID=386913 RepID=A0A7I9XLP1_9MYCO|nr:hypothetical protein MSEN_25440 [Mycolicibacter senuensis]
MRPGGGLAITPRAPGTTSPGVATVTAGLTGLPIHGGIALGQPVTPKVTIAAAGTVTTSTAGTTTALHTLHTGSTLSSPHAITRKTTGTLGSG